MNNKGVETDLACTDTHGCQKDPFLLPSTLAESGDDLASAGGTERVAESDSAAANVHLAMVNIERVEAVHSHRRERLVQFDDVNLIDADIVVPEELGDGDGRANAHDAGCKTGDGRANELGHNGLTEGLGHAALHEQDRGGAIGDLRRVAAGAAVAPLREGRFDLGQRLVRSAPPRTFVLGERDGLLLARLRVLDDGGDGHDLIVEPAGLLRDLGPAERLVRVPVLHLARDVEVRTDVLACLAHGLHTVARLLVLEDLVDEGPRGLAAEAHGFRAQRQAALDGAHGDLVGDIVDGFQA